jgi:hypothetical protein
MIEKHINRAYTSFVGEKNDNYYRVSLVENHESVSRALISIKGESVHSSIMLEIPIAKKIATEMLIMIQMYEDDKRKEKHNEG